MKRGSEARDYKCPHCLDRPEEVWYSVAGPGRRYVDYACEPCRVVVRGVIEPLILLDEKVRLEGRVYSVEVLSRRHALCESVLWRVPA